MAHGKSWMVREKRCWPMCEPCYIAYSRDLKKQAYKIARGLTESSVHSGKSTLLIREMINIYGRRQRWISAECGISVATIKRLYGGTPTEVWPATERKLMTLHARVVADGKIDGGLKRNWTPAELSILGLRGLLAQGWQQTWLSEQLGCNYRSIGEIVTGRQKYVTHEREQAILALVRQVGSKEGPSTRSKRHAARQGWKPTMYYDELV